MKRLAQMVASKWLSKQLQLFERQESSNVLKPVLPRMDETLTQAEELELKKYPGVHEAYQGLGKLSLRVLAACCRL